MQIDVLKVTGNITECNLYTGNRCVKIFMATNEYENLMYDKFFIRDGKEPDSANVINTSMTYELDEDSKSFLNKKKGGTNE